MICIRSGDLGMLLQFAAEGASLPVVVAGLALGLAMGVGIFVQRSRVQATLRLLAAADAYADREIALDPRIPAREFMKSFWPGGFEESGFFSRRKYRARFESQGG